MTAAAREKVISHARDHVAYRWTSGLPVRHDRRAWTPEEVALYNETYRLAQAEYRAAGPTDG